MHSIEGTLLLLVSDTYNDMQDLIQFPDRVNWYKAKFVADDAPDWHAARFVSSRDAAPNLREITLEAEISREKVPLRNGYRHIGQQARVRVNGGSELDVAGVSLTSHIDSNSAWLAAYVVGSLPAQPSSWDRSFPSCTLLGPKA